MLKDQKKCLIIGIGYFFEVILIFLHIPNNYYIVFLFMQIIVYFVSYLNNKTAIGNLGKQKYDCQRLQIWKQYLTSFFLLKLITCHQQYFFIMQQELALQKEFIFCSDQKNPESLVMLASSKHIFDILLTDSEQPCYFWIYQIHANVAEVIKSMPKQIQEQSYVFESFKEMKDFCVGKIFKKIIIICPPQKSNESMQLTRNKQFIGVLQYSIEKTEDNQEFSNQKSTLSVSSFANLQDNNTIKNKRFIQCDSLQDLEQAFSLNQWILCEAKQFSNFVSIKNKVKQSKGYVRSLASMLNHQVTLQTRAQIIDNLNIIATKLLKCHPRLQNSYSPLKQALDEMKVNQLDPNRAFKFYTCQHYQLYVFVNIFLRAMTCSTQIYYFQPFFKDLFNAIVAMSRQKQAIFENRQLICYRGGLISSQEVQVLLQSVGEIVQNLGFLSTSLSEQTAATFKRNILFKVMVPCLKNGYKYNHGYANIKIMSEFSSEQQILFNPLNYFKIMEIKIHSLISTNSLQYQKEYEIWLDYGQAERIHQLPDSLLTQSQMINKILISLHKDMEKDIKTQADIFRYSESKDELEKGLIYNQVYLSSAIGQIQSSIKANNNLGHIYESFGKCKEALLFYEKSIEIWEENEMNGERSQQLYLQALNGKADCLNQDGSYKEAYLLYMQVAATYKEVTSDQDSKYISLIIKIARVIIRLGKIEEAKKLYKQSEHIIEAAVQQKHPKYFPILQGMINILSNLGKYQQALSLHNRFSNILRQVLGEQHPDYLSALHNLANLYLVSGRNQESLILYNKCEKARQSILGQNHPDYLNTLHNKASLLMNMCKFQQAIAISLKCQENRKQLLGDRHPDYLNTAKVTANGAFYQGKFKQALELYNKIQVVQKEIIGEMHPDYLSTLSDIADAFVALNRKEEALYFYKRCLILRKQVMGENHPKYLNTLSSIATVKFYQGKYEQALEIYQVYKKVSEELLGVRHPNYLAALYNIANVFLKLEQFEKALLLYKQVGGIQKQVLGVKHPQYISTLHNMCQALLGLGQSEQVLYMYRRFQPIFLQKDIYINQFQILCVKANCQLGEYVNLNIQELIKVKGHSLEDVFPALHKILLDNSKYKDANLLTKLVIRQLKKSFILNKQDRQTRHKDKIQIMAKIRYCKQKQADTYTRIREISIRKKQSKTYFDF